MRKLFAEHEPADLTANLTCLDNRRSVVLPQIAPAVYMMGVVSKAANYQTLLLKSFMALPHSQKHLVSMITAPYEKEAWEGCEIMLRLEKAALEALATSKERAFTEWNQRECNKFVAHHMGWLAEALNRKTLVKISSVSQPAGKILKLTNSNSYVTASKLTPSIAAAYISLAHDGALAVACGGLSDFATLHRFAQTSATSASYHNKWAFRTVTQALRKTASGNLDLPVGATVDEFKTVYPDEGEYLESLAWFYNTRSISRIMREIGETGDAGDFTMWLCFNGWLRPFHLDMSQMSEVKKQVKTHSIKYMNTIYKPHMTNTMERVALAQ